MRPGTSPIRSGAGSRADGSVEARPSGSRGRHAPKSRAAERSDGRMGRANTVGDRPALADIPTTPPAGEDVERVALTRSLDLSTARQRIIVAGQQLGYSRATALIPDAEIGPGAEREGDEAWKVGPVLTVPIPLFDQGQARVGRAVAELRRAQQEHYALAVRIRAAARAISDRLLGAQDRALYYRDIVLPLQERIVAESQLQLQRDADRRRAAAAGDRERQIEARWSTSRRCASTGWRGRPRAACERSAAGRNGLRPAGAGAAEEDERQRGTLRGDRRMPKRFSAGRCWEWELARWPPRAHEHPRPRAASPISARHDASVITRWPGSWGQELQRWAARCHANAARAARRSTTSRRDARTARAAVQGRRRREGVPPRRRGASSTSSRRGYRPSCWGYNGRVHGPTIEAVEGDRVRIYVTNGLPAPTTCTGTASSCRTAWTASAA